MKILILNGSPRKNGDTAYVLNQLIKEIPQEYEIEELNLYYENIKPCIDCRYCWSNKGCSIKDKMEFIWKYDFDIIVVASPVYMCNLTPPLLSFVTRLNMKWFNKNYLKLEDYDSKYKKGILILVGGGSGAPDCAIKTAKIIFNILNAIFNLDEDYIYSLNTDNVPVKEDENLIKLVKKVTKNNFNNN